MGDKTEFIEAAKKQGLDIEKVGKGGLAAILIGIILYFGSNFMSQQDELTKAIIDGNSTMKDLVHSHNNAVDEMREAVDEMKEARIIFESRDRE